ncbi:hypothetical protein EDD16DRAFT_1480937 [Pisolithus croceorrhizus]|nr:hypothetical protein EDD16DRAFT_1480937 [Pisolithus croceorrhizus]
MPQIQSRWPLVTTLSRSASTQFNLNSTSVAGFFGGEEAISTMILTQTYNRGIWFGWYNTLGSFVIGNRFRRLADLIISNSLVGSRSDTRFQRMYLDPTPLLQHGGWPNGPAFKAIYSGINVQETGPFASLLMKRCIRVSGTPISGRATQLVNVTLARFERRPIFEQQLKCHRLPPTLAVLPVAVSLAACVLCVLYGELYSFFVILLGILARGLSGYFIGSMGLSFDFPGSAEGSLPGDGILGGDRELVLLKGSADVVNAIIRGRLVFSLLSRNAHRGVQLCSFLLVTQAIVQLLCIPQSSLFGQLMFVSSIVTSWAYEVWFLSSYQEIILWEILNDVMGPLVIKKFVLPNRCGAVASLLFLADDRTHLGHMKMLMDDLLPSGVLVWEIWKEVVLEHLHNRQPLRFDDTHWNRPDLSSADEKSLLRVLLKDAEVAYAAFSSRE